MMVNICDAILLDHSELSVDIPLDIVIVILSEKPGYCFDINMKSFQYRYFRYKDSIVSRPCYLYNGIPLKYCLYI